MLLLLDLSFRGAIATPQQGFQTQTPPQQNTSPNTYQVLCVILVLLNAKLVDYCEMLIYYVLCTCMLNCSEQCPPARWRRRAGTSATANRYKCRSRRMAVLEHRTLVIIIIVAQAPDRAHRHRWRTYLSASHCTVRTYLSASHCNVYNAPCAYILHVYCSLNIHYNILP